MPLSDFTSPLTNAEITEKSIREKSSTLKTICYQTYMIVIQEVFVNSRGLTPQEAADTLGNEAESFFKAYGFIRDALLETNAGYSLPVPNDYGYTVSYDGDGTVTITAI